MSAQLDKILLARSSKLHVSCLDSLNSCPSTSLCFTFLSPSLQLNSFNPIKLSCFVISAVRPLELDRNMVKAPPLLAENGAGITADDSVGRTGSHVGLLEEAERLRSCLGSLPCGEFLSCETAELHGYPSALCLCVCACCKLRATARLQALWVGIAGERKRDFLTSFPR